MKDFHVVPLKEFTLPPFQALDDQWMLITAAKPDGTVNTMTASWGGFGIMWNRCATFMTLRPQRYTREFVDASGCYSFCFFSEEHRESLDYLGEVSGREEDKIAKTPLTVATHQGIPYFEEAQRVIFCKTMAVQRLPEDVFVDKSLLPEFYPDKDFHYLYIAHVTEIWEK